MNFKIAFLRVFSLAVCLFVVNVALAQGKGTYRINGTLTNGRQAKVMLIKAEPIEGENDTLSVIDVTNGKFVFKDKIDSPMPVYLTVQLQYSKRDYIVFLEGGAVYTATIDVSSSYGKNIVSGTPMQELVNKLGKIETEVFDLRLNYANKSRVAQNAKALNALKKDFDEKNKIVSDAEDELIREFPDSPVIPFMIKRKMVGADADELLHKYELMGEANKNSVNGQQILQYSNNIKSSSQGSIIENFTLNTPDNKPVSLYGVDAKIKLIDFWSSTCHPCRKKNPQLLELYNEYHSKGLEIIGISLDSNKESWEKAIKMDKLPWINVSSLKGWKCPVIYLYAVTQLPALIMVDGHNRIIAKDPTIEEIKKILSKRLK